MKTISLLPPELKSRKLAQGKQNNLLVGATLLVIAIVLVYSALFVNSIFLRIDLKGLKTERISVEQAAASLEEYAILHEQLIAAEKLVAEAMGTVPPWGNLLQEIGLILPVGVWLSEASARYEVSSGELNLRGWGYDYNDVAVMLEAIYSIDQLADIRCQVSSETVYGGQPVVQFTINAQVKTGPDFMTITDGGS